MAQLFHPRSNAIFRLVLLLVFGGTTVFAGWGELEKWSSWTTEKDVTVEQPVPFSHQHHVRGLGLDCRYCHSLVEKSASAGMPSSHTCMTCHSQIWTQARLLEPVRESFRSGQPLRWQRVYRLPDYVYFEHAIHVNKGIGCSSCHGQIDRMALTRKFRTFYMRDCLSCHREPEKYIRPVEDVFNMDWQPPQDAASRDGLGRALVERYHVPRERLMDCYTCHR